MEDGGKVLEDSLSALLNGSGDEVAILVSRNLARDEDEAVGLDSLGL